MVDCTVRWKAVKAIWMARFRGHGWVKRSLEALGVPRSSGYRWDKCARWLFETGVARLRAQAAELAAVREEAAEVRAGAAAASSGMSRRQLERLVVHAAVLGTSDTDAAQFVAQAGGPQLSHTTVWEIVSRWSEVASVVFQRYFQGVGETAAVGEIYLGKKPLLLLTCEPVSLLMNGLRLAEGRSAEDWRPVFTALRELKHCSADGALGIRSAAKERGVEANGDMFHLLGPARLELGTLAHRVDGAETKAASNGSQADVVELAVLRAVDLALRSSSSVECINSRVRLVQVARKRLSEHFVCLMAVHHNMRTFGRGSVREGHTPAELAGIPLPTNDFFELLEMTASDLSASAVAA